MLGCGRSKLRNTTGGNATAKSRQAVGHSLSDSNSNSAAHASSHKYKTLGQRGASGQLLIGF